MQAHVACMHGSLSSCACEAVDAAHRFMQGHRSFTTTPPRPTHTPLIADQPPYTPTTPQAYFSEPGARQRVYHLMCVPVFSAYINYFSIVFQARLLYRCLWGPSCPCPLTELSSCVCAYVSVHPQGKDHTTHTTTPLTPTIHPPIIPSPLL